MRYLGLRVHEGICKAFMAAPVAVITTLRDYVTQIGGTAAELAGYPLSDDPDWMKKMPKARMETVEKSLAQCLGEDPYLFYLKTEEPARYAETKAAIAQRKSQVASR